MSIPHSAQPASAGASPFGKAFGGTAPENYERYFVPLIGRPFAADLVAAAGLRPGDRVLDVACGTGVVARLAAERVGTGGTVAGVDMNPGMLAVARAAAGAQVQWYETSAESMPLPDAAFDVVFCQLGLMFIGDKPAALREIRRVLAPHGRVLVSSPRPTSFFNVLDDVLSRRIGDEAGAFVRMIFSLSDPSEIERLFRAAGFAHVTVRTEQKLLPLPPAREFFQQYVHSTPLSGLLAQQDADRLAAIDADIVLGWQPWAVTGGMQYEQGMIVTAAGK